jgi:predicted dehydrogenase
MTDRLRVVLIGCGALAELYYAPALAALATPARLRVEAVIDPSPDRRRRLARSFAGARELEDLAELAPGSADLAIIASPPRVHAAQALLLARLGVHVLCEKPLATTLAEARAMVEAFATADRLLAVGLFRRFFPTSEWILQLVRGGALGAPRSFEWSEGGPFNWPAATPSFFQKSGSGGGVLADAGIHVLDLLAHWFGPPSDLAYEDDALGGLEANALLRLSFPSGFRGSVRLSRDTEIPNLTRLRFERGSVSFSGASARSLAVELDSCAQTLCGSLHESARLPGRLSGEASCSYQQAFMAQITDLARCIRENSVPRVAGPEALIGMELVERCYRERRPLSLPWLTDEELVGVRHLARQGIAQ